MRKLFSILTVMMFPFLGNAQSEIIEQLKTDYETDLSLFFYPSTLRMVNLQKNEEFNELVKDIKKMSFLKLNKRQFNQQEFMNAVTGLQQKEEMEEYIVIDGKDQKFYLLGRESPASTVALAFFENEYYAIDIAGSISLAELPKLYEQLSQNDSALKNDFTNIFDIVSKTNSFGNDRNHRKRERIRD